MARRFRRGRGQRRRTAWVLLGTLQTAGSNQSANVDQDVLLYAQPAADTNPPFTLIRIIGGVHMSAQASPANVVSLYWGIYMAKSGGGGAYRLVASNATDVSEETWLHWRVQYAFLADDQTERPNDAVDIKVMRKFVGGDELRLNFNSTAAYHTAYNLRALLMYT